MEELIKFKQYLTVTMFKIYDSSPLMEEQVNQTIILEKMYVTEEIANCTVGYVTGRSPLNYNFIGTITTSTCYYGKPLETDGVKIVINERRKLNLTPLTMLCY